MGCDNCGSWLHIKCCGVTPSQYIAFQKGEGTDSWQCPVCTPGNVSIESSSSDSVSSNLSDHSAPDTAPNLSRPTQRSTPQNPPAGRLKIAVINVNSIKSRGKQGCFKAFIDDHNPDIIIACETEITKDTVDEDILPPKYESIRDDKCDKKHGVLIAYKTDLVVEAVELIDKTSEFVLAKLQVENGPDLYLGSFYRHTNMDPSSLNSLYDNLHKVMEEKGFPHMIIAGDFNLPDVSWDTQTYHPKPQYGKTINTTAVNIMSDLSLTQLVSEPTRGNNILDVIFSSVPDLMDNVTVGPGISDHSAVFAEAMLKVKRTKRPTRKVFLYSKADPAVLKSEIGAFKDSFLKDASRHNADDNWNCFRDGLMEVVRRVVPQKKVRSRQDLPWLDHHLRKKIKKKNRSHRRAKKAKPQNKSQRWKTYRKQQEDTQKSVKLAYDRYINSLFEDQETHRPSKRFYKTLKAKRRDQVGIPPLRGRNGTLDSTSKGKANLLNAQYTSVFKDEDPSNIPDLGASPYRSLPKINVSGNGVKKLLENLNPRKAVGPDFVPTQILKEFKEDIAPILQVIFQQSLDTGVVPEDWKTANVVGVFKKGDRHQPSNYRPVSLTCVSCKLLEHIVFRAVMDHVDFHKILKFFQHGFREKHSCETQLINTIEDLSRGLNNQQQLDLLILDFSKAFDLVGHQRLLKKLQFYGIRDTTLQWISSWLVERTQKVVVDGANSSASPVTSGVPQGTVLGPLQFILYINHINVNTTSSIRLFADDCLLYRHIRTAQDAEELQRDLTQLCRWADVWQMDFNATKCNILSVTRKKCPIRAVYSIRGVQLEQVVHNPYLGVELAADLDWGHHVKNVVPKAQRTLNLLRRNMWGCSRETKDIAYRTLVRPVLDYAGAAWDPFQANHIEGLEKIQRRAARFVTGRHSREDSVTDMLKDLQWRSLQERRLTSRLCMLHKTVNGNAACDLPHDVAAIPATTRSSHQQQYSVPPPRKDTYKFSFFPRTLRVWNLLPAHIVEAGTLLPPHVGIAERTAIFKSLLLQEFESGRMYTVPPRGLFNRPRLGSTGAVHAVGPVY